MLLTLNTIYFNAEYSTDSLFRMPQRQISFVTVTLLFVIMSEQIAGRSVAFKKKSHTNSTAVMKPHYLQQILMLQAELLVIASKRCCTGKKYY